MKSLTIAKYTFTEVYRSKIMIGLVFIAFGILLVSYIAAEFAYGASEKVALDFGIGMLSISNLIISIFLGATLLRKEIETKTLYMIISKPISRAQFLIGKILGLLSVLVLNTLLVTLITSIIFLILGGKWDTLILWTAFFTLLESTTILCVSVLFSLISNTALAVLFTIVFLVVGHTLNETLNNFFAKSNLIFLKTLQIFGYIIPDLERINLKDFLLYKQNIEASYLINNFFYISFYIVALLILISVVFDRKNLD